MVSQKRCTFLLRQLEPSAKQRCKPRRFIVEASCYPIDRSPLFVPALMRVRLLIVAPSRTAHLRLPTRTTLRTPKVSGSLARYAAVGGCGAHGTPRPEPSLQST